MQYFFIIKSHISNKMSTNVTHDECLLIPLNDPTLVLLGKATIPIAVMLFVIKVVLSKNINTLPFKKCLTSFYFTIDHRSYKEIFVNLIFIWLVCGQLSAGLATILYTKSDKHFIETITHNELDELSIYMRVSYLMNLYLFRFAI